MLFGPANCINCSWPSFHFKVRMRGGGWDSDSKTILRLLMENGPSGTEINLGKLTKDYPDKAIRLMVSNQSTSPETMSINFITWSTSKIPLDCSQISLKMPVISFITQQVVPSTLSSLLESRTLKNYSKDFTSILDQPIFLLSGVWDITSVDGDIKLLTSWLKFFRNLHKMTFPLILFGQISITWKRK